MQRHRRLRRANLNTLRPLHVRQHRVRDRLQDFSRMRQWLHVQRRRVQVNWGAGDPM